jgi:hypothetical protein
MTAGHGRGLAVYHNLIHQHGQIALGDGGVLVGQQFFLQLSPKGVYLAGLDMVAGGECILLPHPSQRDQQRITGRLVLLCAALCDFV